MFFNLEIRVSHAMGSFIVLDFPLPPTSPTWEWRVEPPFKSKSTLYLFKNRSQSAFDKSESFKSYNGRVERDSYGTSCISVGQNAINSWVTINTKNLFSKTLYWTYHTRFVEGLPLVWLLWFSFQSYLKVRNN